jgi:hypothetical protein
VVIAPSPGIAVGSPVPLKLLLTNISDHDIGFSEYNVSGPMLKHVRLRQVDVQIRDGDGKLVAETEYGRAIHGRSVGQPGAVAADTSQPGRAGAPPRDVLSVLLPGRTLTEESDLSKEFDLSRPGKYTVQATARRTDPDTGLRVQSNTLTLTITP